MRDAFPLGERGEAFAGTVSLHSDDRRAETFGERHVYTQRFRILRPNPAGPLVRRFDVDRVPFRSQPAGDARTVTQHSRRSEAGAHTHHDALGDERRLTPAITGNLTNFVDQIWCRHMVAAPTRAGASSDV